MPFDQRQGRPGVRIPAIKRDEETGVRIRAQERFRSRRRISATFKRRRRLPKIFFWRAAKSGKARPLTASGTIRPRTSCRLRRSSVSPRRSGASTLRENCWRTSRTVTLFMLHIVGVTLAGVKMFHRAWFLLSSRTSDLARVSCTSCNCMGQDFAIPHEQRTLVGGRRWQTSTPLLWASTGTSQHTAQDTQCGGQSGVASCSENGTEVITNHTWSRSLKRFHMLETTGDNRHFGASQLQPIDRKGGCQQDKASVLNSEHTRKFI